MEELHLEGIWACTAFERDGQKWSDQQAAAMAKLVFIPESGIPGWDGVWAAVRYGHQGGRWSEKAVKCSCRHTILGVSLAVEPPGPDFYLWSGGLFRLAPRKLPKEVDLEQFWMGRVQPFSLQLGIYSMDGDRLTLCLAWPGQPRPSTFGSGGTPDRSLQELVRQAASSA
jgi:uncharacterized protein (TIGR03067 family)